MTLDGKALACKLGVCGNSNFAFSLKQIDADPLSWVHLEDPCCSCLFPEAFPAKDMASVATEGPRLDKIRFIKELNEDFEKLLHEGNLMQNTKNHASKSFAGPCLEVYYSKPDGSIGKMPVTDRAFKALAKSLGPDERAVPALCAVFEQPVARETVSKGRVGQPAWKTLGLDGVVRRIAAECKCSCTCHFELDPSISETPTRIPTTPVSLETPNARALLRFELERQLREHARKHPTAWMSHKYDLTTRPFVCTDQKNGRPLVRSHASKFQKRMDRLKSLTGEEKIAQKRRDVAINALHNTKKGYYSRNRQA